MPKYEVPAEWLTGQAFSAMDVAQFFNVSTATVTKWAQRGVIGYFRTPHGARRYPEAEVIRLMEGKEDSSERIRQHAVADSAEYRQKWKDGWHRNDYMLAGYEKSEAQKAAAAESKDDGA